MSSDSPLRPGDACRTLSVGGLERRYWIHVPPQYDGATAMPVVLAFHGGASNGEQMARFCGLSETADAAGFLCVYPNGSGRLPRVLTWNGGNCCGYARQQQIDDVAFVRGLLSDLATVAAIDRRRVFATGMSNGAIFSYRLASELSDQIAAIAPVAGSMGTATCAPIRPVPVIHFHGSDDDFCPIGGGRGRKSVSGTEHFSVEHAIQAWIKADGCPTEPDIWRLESDVRWPDGGVEAVVRKTYGPGRDCAEVVLYIVEGGGHTWPGRHPRLFFLGRSTHLISANDRMWDFFSRHPMEEMTNEARMSKE
ncbi:MAG TPA: PHB depolymerase family esterase [Pirellulales bacterium]|jgi:polyhydroxybutyrate depolymerase|nr:PHB depolymerase family esterase [Pirellulales bacterium]